MTRPGWASSRVARRWLAFGAVALLLLAGRVGLRQFGAEATLPDGARVYATCKEPWRSARVAAPADRFTLWVMTGGTGGRRAEGVSALGAHCRVGARRRMALAAVLLAAGAVLIWLALPPRREATHGNMPG